MTLKSQQNRKLTSLDPVFMPATTDMGPLRTKLKRGRVAADIAAMLLAADFHTVTDLIRTAVIETLAHAEAAKAIEMVTELDALVQADTSSDEKHRLNVHAALMQILTSLYLVDGQLDKAAETAALTLTLLAQEPKRKDAPFQEILAPLLYDIATLHSERREYKQAEREIEKAIKLFERLAKAEPLRFAPPHMMALDGATAIYRNRVKQAELLAHYQAATSTYMEMLDQGVEDAADRLAESLAAEGATLAAMGKHREAMQYYSRALKYVTRIEPEFTLRQLQLSIALGESMLQIAAMRDKGVHLLNTMLHKATKINASAEHRRIVDVLYSAKSRSLDILTLWHKVFPR